MDCGGPALNGEAQEGSLTLARSVSKKSPPALVGGPQAPTRWAVAGQVRAEIELQLGRVNGARADGHRLELRQFRPLRHRNPRDKRASGRA